MAEFVKAANLRDIPQDSAKRAKVGGRDIAVFNVGGKFYAIDNVCPHEGGSLCEGAIFRHEVTCPLHEAAFDIRTGEVLGPPATENVRSYRVRVRGTDLEVEV